MGSSSLNVDVSSFGDTRDEGREAIKGALELYFEDVSGTEVIEVAEVEVEAVNVEAILS